MSFGLNFSVYLDKVLTYGSLYQFPVSRSVLLQNETVTVRFHAVGIVAAFISSSLSLLQQCYLMVKMKGERST